MYTPRIRCIRRASDVYAADVYAAYTSAVVADIYAAYTSAAAAEILNLL